MFRSSASISIYYSFSFLVYQIFGQYYTQHSRIVTLIHDDSIELQQPKESAELCVRVIAGNLESLCQNSVSMHVISVAPETEHNVELIRGNYDDGFTNAFVIITRCEIAEVIIRRLWTYVNNPNILFLDFFLCQPLQKSKAFHLETFRFKSEIWPGCVQCAVQKWMEETICSFEIDHKTKDIMNFAFSIDTAVEGCCSNTSSDIYLTNLQSEANYVRRFLNGKQLHVASVDDPPWTRLERSLSNSSIINCYGLVFDTFNTFQEHFNFTYAVVMPEFRTYGKTEKNGTWDGLLGMVFNKEADILVDNFYITHLRYSAFDFVLLGTDPWVVLIPPATEDNRLFACTKPFQTQVWIGVLIVLVLLPLIIWIYATNLTAPNRNSTEASLKQIYLLVYSVLVSQSNGPKIPRNKILLVFLVIVWSLIAVILTNVYKAKIVASLLIPKLNPIISSVEELPTSTLRWMVISGTAMEYLFLNTEDKDTVYWKIGEGLRQNPESVISLDIAEAEIRSSVGSGDYAAIYSLSYFKYLMEKDYLETKTCRLTIAKQDFNKPSYVGLVLRKNSPLATIFNRKMLHTMQSGLEQYWRRKTRSKVSTDNVCRNLNSSKGEPRLTLKTLQGTFLILAIGLAIATVVFILEIVYYKITAVDI